MSVSSISNQRIYQNYQSLSSGKRINQASDDAAGLAIAQKLQSQSNGYDVGSRNVGTSQDLLNVADGALSSITDNLQRIRELSVQAANGLYTDADRGAIQSEIDQLKKSIADTASGTQFNTKNLLDGTMGDFHVATGPGGGGMEIGMPNATLQDRARYDALAQVTSARSSIGASSNRLDSVAAYNSNASLNLTASRSRVEDLDYPQAVSKMKKNELLRTFQMMMQRKMMENENGRVLQFFRS